MTTYTVGPNIQALVADIGSYSTKIGYAGEDHPQAVYNSTTAVVRNKHKNSSNNNGGNGVGGSVKSSSSSSSFARGPKRDFATRPLEGSANGGDGDWELANPIDPVTGWMLSTPGHAANTALRRRDGGGEAKDKGEGGGGGSSMSANESTTADYGDAWESHELFNSYLQHAFQNALGLAAPAPSSASNSNPVNTLDYASHHPLLLLDKPHSPPAIRQRQLELLFETHNLPSVFFLRDAIAACYAVGRTTATVVDVGYNSTMVSPVYEGFVETRGVLRNNACGGRHVEERILSMMDEIVVKQGGRRRRDRMRRANQRLFGNSNSTSSSGGGGGGGGNNAGEGSSSTPTKPQTSSNKRDSTGRFLKPSNDPSASWAIPEYLMPLYQVRRAPTYTPRAAPFHHWSRIALVREIKEMGLACAVGPFGYVSSEASGGGEGSAAVVDPANPNNINLATNSMFLASSKLPYTLPDGTPIEITASARYDVAELFFGNDEYNTSHREKVLEESMQKLEEYGKEVEEFLSSMDNGEEQEEKKREEYAAGTNSSSSTSAAGDPYSNTSYHGEKSTRHGVLRGGSGSGRRNKQYLYSPNTISAKLYSACLPYLRTAPPKPDGVNNSMASATGSGIERAKNENYFHYLTSAPPAQMVCDAAFRCDRDQQASLLGNVVVCGGGACIMGGGGVGSGMSGPAGATGGAGVAGGDENAFPDRLREEIEAIVHRHTMGWRVKVSSPNINERAICSWLGGSILGSLGTFQDMWISKKEYEEFGCSIVNRKCP